MIDIFPLKAASSENGEKSNTESVEPNAEVVEPENAKSSMETKSVPSPLLKMFANIRARNVSFH